MSALSAQDTSLKRNEVASIKAKLVAVQQAMGSVPTGYALESEDFNLPTDAFPSRAGNYWPVTSGVWLRYTDQAVQDAEANREQFEADFQQRYVAAMMSGNQEAAQAALAEMMRVQNGDGSMPKEDMSVDVQFNVNPQTGIDPDAVFFEKPGVIALTNYDTARKSGQLVVYFDPVALRETETLSKVELKTPDDGVKNRAGVYNVTISLNGEVADMESWVGNFDTKAVLAVIDSQ